MNILFLHAEPSWAARYHTDRHVAKHLLEIVQILQSAHIALDGIATARHRLGNTIIPVGDRHRDHTYVRWACRSSANYDWAASLFGALLLEFELRNKRRHQFECLVDLLKQRPWQIPMGELTEYPQWVLPSRYHRGDAVQAYREYYFGEKQHLAEWTMPATCPEWWRRMQFAYETKRRLLDGRIRA